MGRNVEIKRIEDATKRQVTFSKRRNNLIQKAKKISICFDADVALVTFSPSGRVSKYCSKRRIEDMLHRYVNLPPESRLNHIKNVQEKQEKLRQLDHIKGDITKLHYLDKQVENLELQIKKKKLELQITEADLRDYEPGKEQEPSLHQLSWCERNLKQSLEKVMSRKNALLGSVCFSSKELGVQMDRVEMRKDNDKEGSMQVSYNIGEKELLGSSAQNPVGQLLLQLDPWISPYSARVRQRILQNLLDQGKGAPLGSSSETLIPPTYTPTQAINNVQNAPLGVHQHVPHRIGQDRDYLNRKDGTTLVNQFNSHQDQFNLYSGGNSNSFQCFTASQPSNPQRLNLPGLGLGPRSRSKSKSAHASLAVPNSNSFPVNAPFITTSTSTVSDVAAMAMARSGLNVNGFEPHQPHVVEPENNNSENINNNKLISAAVIEEPELSSQAREDSTFDNLSIKQDGLGDTKMWTQGIQNTGLWEWEDLFFADNLNLDYLN